MSSTTFPPTSTQGGIFTTRWLVLLWILSGLALGLCVGVPRVQRTQEARVLETARQMRGTGWRGWLVPRINGTLRLQKPPLAYWMSAMAYDLAGVSNASGRMPNVIWGWLTIGVTFIAGRHIFGARAGLIATACLFSSYLFFRHNRLAETDAPSAMFATLAIFAWWSALESSADDAATSVRRPYLLFHIGAIGTAMAIMFKGGPGAYPPVFLLGFVALRRQWHALWTFARSGALITLIALAGPWFWYVQRQTRSEQFAGEVDTLFSGQDHGAPFYRYFPELLKAAAPWSLVMVAAVGFAIAPLVWHMFSRTKGAFRQCFEQWRMTPRAGVVVWAASIFLPLCVIGNKQFHYLLPLMPPVMLLVGGLLNRATRGPAEEIPGAVYALIDATLLGTVLAAPAVPLVARHILHEIRPADWTVAAAVGVTGITVIVLYLWRGRPAALAAYLAGGVLIFPPVIGLWVPTLEPDESAGVARQIHQRYGEGPYVFYGVNYSLPLCFNLRCAIPSMRTPAQLVEASTKSPGLVVIGQTKGGTSPPPPPVGFVHEITLTAPGQKFEIYRSAFSTTSHATHNSSTSESR